MRLLLDTHAIIWWLTDSARLGKEARALFDSSDVALCASIASLWEIAIKRRTGKIEASASLVAAHLADAAVSVLPVEVTHLTMLEQLPLLHRDPFDRLLVAQALVTTATVLTDDKLIADYGVPCVAAGR